MLSTEGFQFLIMLEEKILPQTQLTTLLQNFDKSVFFLINYHKY